MAKLGTVFVELSLDDKVYKQKLSETLTSTTATAKGIEKSWQVLGQKSDTVYQQQVQSYKNALTLIKNSATSTQADILRAEKATADKIKAIHSQQHAHQVSLMSSLKSHYMAITATVAIVAGTVTKLAQAYMEEEAATMKLAVAMGNAGTYTRANLAAMQDYAAVLQQVTKYGDEMTLATMANLQTYGMEIEQLKRATKASMDLAAAKAIDLRTASELVGKAFVGETGTLSRYGIIIDQTLDKSKKFEAVLALIQQRFGGTAQAELETYAGQWAKMKNYWGDVAEKAGLVLLKTLEAIQFALGMVTAGFYTMLEKITAGIAWMVKQMARLPFIGGMFKGVAEGLESISQGYEKAKESALGFADTNLKMLTSFKRVEDFADKTFAGKTFDKKETALAGGGASSAAKALKDAYEMARDLEKKALDDYQRRIEKETELDRKKYQDKLDLMHQAAEEETKAYEKQMQNAEQYRQLMAGFNIDLAEGHERAILQIMEDDRRMADEITKIMDNGGDVDEAMKAFELLAKKTGKAIQEIFEDDLTKATRIFQRQLHDLSAGFSMLSNACMDMAASYEEGSESAKKWEEAARAFEIAQRAVAVVQAVVGIATQAEGEPYSAFPRMAAMAAAMASLLATIGESVNSPSGSATANLPASTVLGAEAGTGSQSIANSYQILEDIYDIENTKLTKIYNELRDLNNNITGLVTSIVRTGGMSVEGMGLNLGYTPGASEKGTTSYIAQNMGFLSDIGNFLNQPVVDVGKWIFGGGVKKSLEETGLAFGGQNISDVLAGGMDAQQYALIKKVKSGWFGSKKTSYSTQYQELDSEVAMMFDKVFQGMSQSLVYFAENLGTGVNDVLNYTFEQTKLDLKDMTAEEMNTAISEYISAASDNAVSALFGDIVGKYQELNEGLMETATRLIVDKEIVASVLEDTGKSFAGTVPQMIEFSEQLIDIAGSLENLTDAAQNYIDKFYTDAEKFASLKETIGDVAGVVPRSREAYRKLVDSIDLTSEIGKQAYYTLMLLADQADAYYSHLEDIANQRADMEIELLEAQGKAAEALAASRKRELEAMDESLRPLQELIWLTQELGTELQTVTTSITTEINALISTSSSAASAARSAANEYRNIIEQLTAAQIAIFGGGRAGAQSRLTDIYGKALTGDKDALSKMPDAVNSLLTASLAESKTSLDYRRDQAKSYIALENSKQAAQAMVNWEEYHATLLETQVNVLEDMRELMTAPDPNLAELQKQATLLQTISTLLSENTVQTVAGNTFIQDQTGKIIYSNDLLDFQNDKILTGNTLTEKQTAQVITGNAVQDVIKNIDDLNTAYTAEMLTELVSGGNNQNNNLYSILNSSITIVSLLGKLVSMTEANEQAKLAKEIELSKSEYNSAIADREDALIALDKARAATATARTTSQVEASQYAQAQDVYAWAVSVYNQYPSAANKALVAQYLTAMDTQHTEMMAAGANLDTRVAQESAATEYYNSLFYTIADLKAATNMLISTYNVKYPDDKIQSLAYGGIASGSESGYEATLHGTELVVSPKNTYPATVKGDSELAKEVKALRQEITTIGYTIAKYTKDTAKTLNKFDFDGLPAERAA